MNKNFPYALSPIRINGALYKNRILVAPITPHASSIGELYPNEDAISYFESRAKTGAAVVYCSGVKAVDVINDGEHCTWDTETFNHKNRLTLLAARIHAQGARAGMEVMGLLPSTWRSGSPLCCSDGDQSMLSQPVGQEITKDEMNRYKQSTANMCANLLECGFDNLLFHFGHSIPIAQFLSPLTNHRKDEYGGTTENRCRYLVEILDACKASTNGQMIMEVRMSATEFVEGGIDVEEGINIAAILQEHCDVIQASCGMITPKYMTWTHPCQHMGYHPNLWLAESFKKSGRINKPVTAIGGFESLQAAEDAIATGKCDFVAFCRQLIADPNTLKKEIDGHSDDVIPCIRCMRCHDSDCYEHLFRCSVNPEVGFEAYKKNMFLAKPLRSKRVAIIGGGPAGMKAAITAYDRGHEVTLYEKEDQLGGALNFSRFVDFKYALSSYKDYLIHQVKKRKIDVKTNSEVDSEMLNGKYDALIVAIGAEPIMLPIPGYNIGNGILATEVYGNEKRLGQRVIIIGGGQVGCETALYLLNKGFIVSVIEMQKKLCPEASETCGEELRILLNESPNFTAYTNSTCKKITKDSVTYISINGKESLLNCDNVVLAAGMKAKTRLADKLVSNCDILEWAQVGDCVKARTIEQATAEAYYAAMNL